MKLLLLIQIFTTVFILSCRNTTGSATKPSDAEGRKKGFYFDYILDGKESHADAADIVSTYYPYKHNQFTIYAGKEDSVNVLLTVWRDIRKTSLTPSGSADPVMNIIQGSISLQDYPEKNYTSHSYNNSSPEATPIVPNAIVITGSEKEGDTARIITGTTNAKSTIIKRRVNEFISLIFYAVVS